jgi:putative colanic acid biosynthesis acetyltransferase WcaF
VEEHGHHCQEDLAMPIQNNDPFTQPSFALSNRIARALWGLVWALFFRTSPRPFHAWRRFLLRSFGATIGQNVNIYPDVKIWAPWSLSVGNRVGIANGVTLYNMAKLTVGDNCVISQGAHLCGGTHDIDSANFQLLAKPITLGNHVWICADVFVGPGVTIADGCVLGARAVLCKSITAEWTLWNGNPAAFKRNRTKQ